MKPTDWLLVAFFGGFVVWLVRNGIKLRRLERLAREDRAAMDAAGIPRSATYKLTTRIERVEGE